MIVPMKKIAVIVQAKDAVSAVTGLRKLGVVHVERQGPAQSKDLHALQEDMALLKNALEVFSSIRGKTPVAVNSGCLRQPASNGADWKIAARHALDLWKRYDQLDVYLQGVRRAIAEWERWGDFDPSQINALAQKGIFIKLYQTPLEAAPPLGGASALTGQVPVLIKQIFTYSGMAHCLAISRKSVELPFKEIPLPKQSVSEMRRRLNEDVGAMDQIKAQLEKLCGCVSQLVSVRKNLEKEIEFQEALSGMGKEASFAYLSGYVPVDSAISLLKQAKQNSWAVTINDPAEEDNVPTLVRNPAWVSLIKPVFRLLEIVPGYRELDISLLFLVFFSLFFGILIGDAGYGMVYLALTFLVQRKIAQKKQVNKEFFLFYVLSFCAIAWGLLTGTFFGQAWLAGTGFKGLVPALNDLKSIQTFCFFLGALHLTLAHSWKAVLKLPSLAALADIGWVFILWSAFFFARFLILSEALPSYIKWLVWAGVGAVVLFSSPQKNILKAVGQGLGALALNLMNNFTDVVSYVRLFAVGLAGVAIADTFNSMAAGFGRGSILAVVAGGFIIVAGHGLNLILGPMSVLVHGVRLNVLEFSGHAGVSWSGVAYKPLRE